MKTEDQSPTVNIDSTEVVEKQEKYAEILRKMNEQESAVMNNRFTWLMASESLLFATLAVAATQHMKLLATILAITGFLVSASGIAASAASERAYENLKAQWKRLLPEYKGPSRVGYDLREVEDEDNLTPWCWKWALPHLFLPRIFVIGWLVLLLLCFFNFEALFNMSG